MCTTALTGCPARSGSSPALTSRRIASCKASWHRCGCVRASSAPAGADSASSTVPTIDAHSGDRSPVSTPAPPNVVSTRTHRSANASSSSPPPSWPSSASPSASLSLILSLGRERA